LDSIGEQLLLLVTWKTLLVKPDPFMQNLSQKSSAWRVVAVCICGHSVARANLDVLSQRT